MGNCVCAEAEMDHELISVKKKKKEKKYTNGVRLYRGIKLYLYLMLKLCVAMESCTFLSFYCKYVKKQNMLPGLHSSALVKN